jgi:hypothetical protein
MHYNEGFLPTVHRWARHGCRPAPPPPPLHCPRPDHPPQRPPPAAPAALCPLHRRRPNPDQPPPLLGDGGAAAEDAVRHAQEERRLAHVAATRAQERLYVSSLRVINTFKGPSQLLVGEGRGGGGKGELPARMRPSRAACAPLVLAAEPQAPVGLHPRPGGADSRHAAAAAALLRRSAASGCPKRPAWWRSAGGPPALRRRRCWPGWYAQEAWTRTEAAGGGVLRARAVETSGARGIEGWLVRAAAGVGGWPRYMARRPCDLRQEPGGAPLLVARVALALRPARWRAAVQQATY